MKIIALFVSAVVFPACAREAACAWPADLTVTEERRKITVELCERVNAERLAVDAPALQLVAKAITAAQGHAEDMAARDYFSHDSPEGETFFQRLTRAGAIFTASAENIAYGQPTAEEVMKSWMNSTGHRTNLLNPAFRTLGIGMQDTRWVQNFTD